MFGRSRSYISRPPSIRTPRLHAHPASPTALINILDALKDASPGLHPHPPTVVHIESAPSVQQWFTFSQLLLVQTTCELMLVHIQSESNGG